MINHVRDGNPFFIVMFADSSGLEETYYFLIHVYDPDGAGWGKDVSGRGLGLNDGELKTIQLRYLR